MPREIRSRSLTSGLASGTAGEMNMDVRSHARTLEEHVDDARAIGGRLEARVARARELPPAPSSRDVPAPPVTGAVADCGAAAAPDRRQVRRFLR
jgi:hypothetical protein